MNVVHWIIGVLAALALALVVLDYPLRLTRDALSRRVHRTERVTL